MNKRIKGASIYYAVFGVVWAVFLTAALIIYLVASQRTETNEFEQTFTAQISFELFIPLVIMIAFTAIALLSYIIQGIILVAMLNSRQHIYGNSWLFMLISIFVGASLAIYTAAKVSKALKNYEEENPRDDYYNFEKDAEKRVNS
ncbi:hypothetical protein ACA758_03935 [Mycoplasmopsis agassizii]|uniref:hypothetical protein n=1 Tax=Mycoplasmopsis agassizii TaxID=33922 RepID=UPI00352737F0